MLFKYFFDAATAPPGTDGTVGARLKWLRGNESQQSFADFLGIGRSTLARYESDEYVPDAEVILKLAVSRNVDPLWLLTGRGAPNADARASSVDGDFVKVPFFDQPVAAGHGAAALLAAPMRWNAWRREYLARRGLQADWLAEFTVENDSMEPELRGGDTVLVNMNDRAIRAGSIYVLRIGDDLVVKYLQRLPGERIQVSSANDAYPTYEISEAELDHEVEIIGRVVRQGRDR